jgi:hypothetical protein
MAQTGRPLAPPYVSFKTFLNFLEWLNEDGVVLPSRLDRSFWGERLSGANGSQLMAGLRFLGLVDRGNRPQHELEEMAQDQTTEREKRKAIIRKRLVECYSKALQGLDLQRVTPEQLKEHFSTYSVDGDTLRKAMAFFVHAAEYCGMRLSPHITKKARTAKKTNGARKRARLAKRRLSEEEMNPAKPAPDLTEESRLHSSLQGLLDDLLRIGKHWTQEQQDRWLKTFTETVKYAYPVGEKQLPMKWQ